MAVSIYTTDDIGFGNGQKLAEQIKIKEELGLNLETVELLGLNLDDYVVVDDEVVHVDGRLVTWG